MSRTVYIYPNGEMALEFDEDRIDAIGRNGGEGLHYPPPEEGEENKQEEIDEECGV
jgi:hypothetical protein